MFDAYTVKKVLPRLVAAVVLIQLSWFIFTGMIQLTTSLSYGIEGLMMAPFGGSDALSLKEIFSSVGGLGSGAGIAGLALVGVVGTIAAGGLIALGIMVFLALFVGFMTLIMRKALLIALLLLSPIALVAWILPGTERFWKIWWDNFSKLLLMFPLILIMMAAGRIFAYIFAASPGSDFGILDVSIILISVFVPFALIPLTYKAAGAGLGALSGAIGKYPGDWTNKARERGRKRQAQKGSDFMGGNLKERSAIGARVNKIGAGLGVGAEGRLGLGKRGRSAVGLRRQAMAEENAKNNVKIQQLALNNDDGVALSGLSGGTEEGFRQASAQLRQHWMNAELARNGGDAGKAQAFADAKLEKAQTAARAAGINRANAGAAFNLLAQNKARSLDGEGAHQLIATGAARLGGGDADATAEALHGFEYHARNAGRYDIGESTATKGWERGSLYQLANAHPSSIKGAGREMVARTASGADADMEAATVFHQELQAMLPNSTGQTRDAILEQMGALEGAGVTAWANTATGRLDPTTGRAARVDRKVTYDAANPDHTATTGPGAWTTEERKRGWRNESREETRADVASRKARTYQRPDEENR